MEWINFRHLYSFWMVCRFSGFKKAADQMNVSQSAVSEQVAQLEEYFDQKLLDRTTRSLKPTLFGQELLKRADRIFMESREINHFLKEHRSSSTPLSMRVGIVGGISRNFLYRYLRNVLVDIESVDINVINGDFHILNKMLKSFELDVVFSLELPSRADLLNLSYQLVEESPLCLAGRKEVVQKVSASRRRQTRPVNIFNFQHPQKGHIITDIIERDLNIEAHCRFETDDISLLRFFANSGEGLAVIPEIGVEEDLKSGSLRRLPLKNLPGIQFYAVYLREGLHEQLIHSFI